MNRILRRRRREAPNGTSADRGRPLDVREVAAVVFRARVNASWVERHVAPRRRVVWGGASYWYKPDARDWYREYELLHTRRRGA
jgi:hypothetical protein